MKTTLTKIDGIAAAYSADDIVGGATSTDAGVKAWRLSYVAGRSGDFLFTPKRNWIVHPTAGSDHGTVNDYDQVVVMAHHLQVPRPEFIELVGDRLDVLEEKKQANEAPRDA